MKKLNHVLIFLCASLCITVITGLDLKGHYEHQGIYKPFNIKSHFSLKCTADEVVDIVWWKNDSEIKAGEHYEISVTKDRKAKTTMSELRIAKAKNEDSGDYSCRVVKENKVQKFMVVGVVAVKLPSNFAVVQGEKMKLHCIAVGYKPVISWILPGNVTIEDGAVDSSDSRITIENEGEIEGNVLIIDPAEHKDRGEYICEGRSADEFLFREIAKEKLLSTKSYVRVKDKLAALWPFIGICSEVFLLCAIILFYEKRHSSNVEVEDSDTEQSPEQKKGRK